MRRILLALSFSCVAASAYAQTGPCPAAPTTTVPAPKNLCFFASPDHAALDLGIPVVSSYEVAYCTKDQDQTSCSPIQTQDIGKPTPNASNAIWMSTTTTPTLFATPVGMEYRTVIIVHGEDAGLFARYPAGSPFGQPSHQAPRVPATGAVATP